MQTIHLTPPYLREKDIARFWWYVDKTPGFGPHGNCWIWVGTMLGAYGRFTTHARGITRRDKAHRIAYYLNTGEWPGEMHVCHHCDYAICVHYEHLFKGTAVDNRRDCVQKGRQWKGDVVRQFMKNRPFALKYANATLTPADIPLLRQLRAEGKTYRECAAVFKVSISSIGRALNGETWSNF